jgi:EAL domain-containing protein (putative c-di-GMP-specific phosphodiesterase class I)
VLEAFAAPILIDGLALDVSASIGVALAPEQAATPAELLKRADVAMYAAKQEHGSVVVYDADYDTSSPKRLALAAALRQAIADRSLTEFVQPQTSLSTGEVVCVEALARWIDPERGFVPPDEFIPLAERTGLIGPLTDLVLDTAIAACAAWQGRAPGVGVAINLSARSLRDDSLDDQVGRLLRRHRLPARLLTQEVTESSAKGDPARTVQVLNRLRASGIRLSIDDFGTGYSSLAYLRRLPVQEVKVDRSFVQRMDVEAEDAAIVRSILELARALDLEVVAEGVETETTLQILRDLGCDVAQGYHISRPMPVEEFADWVTAWSPSPAGRPQLAAVAEA